MFLTFPQPFDWPFCIKRDDHIHYITHSIRREPIGTVFVVSFSFDEKRTFYYQSTFWWRKKILLLSYLCISLIKKNSNKIKNFITSPNHWKKTLPSNGPHIVLLKLVLICISCLVSYPFSNSLHEYIKKTLTTL